EEAMREAGEPLYVPPAKRQKEELPSQNKENTPPKSSEKSITSSEKISPQKPLPQKSSPVKEPERSTSETTKKYSRRSRRRITPKGVIPDPQLYSVIRDHLALLKMDDATITKSKLKSIIR